MTPCQNSETLDMTCQKLIAKNRKLMLILLDEPHAMY